MDNIESVKTKTKAQSLPQSTIKKFMKDKLPKGTTISNEFVHYVFCRNKPEEWLTLTRSKSFQKNSFPPSVLRQPASARPKTSTFLPPTMSSRLSRPMASAPSRQRSKPYFLLIFLPILSRTLLSAPQLYILSKFQLFWLPMLSFSV